MVTISTVIITKNEEHNIESCINSVLWTDEIVVVDSSSSDNTQKICKKYFPKVKLYVMDWPGFGKQKKRALQLATSEWILSIDADERVSSELKQEILAKLAGKLNYNGFRIPRKTYFLKQAINFSYGQDAPTRLAKKNCCNFTDDIVHEKLVVKGEVAKLEQQLHHFSFEDLEELLKKTNLYSTLGAQQLMANGVKTSFTKALLHGVWGFCRVYFLRLGFLDGRYGFIIALNSFEAIFYKYIKSLKY